MAGRKRALSVEDRLYEKIDKRGPEECWPWLGYVHKGYAIFSIGKQKEHALRIAFELASGTLIPDGMEMDHTCGNRLCCNPAHGEIVTHAENMRRAWARGRMHSIGSPGPHSMGVHYRDTQVFKDFIADPRPWTEKWQDHGIARSTAFIWAKQGVQKRYHVKAPTASFS